jgi:hypothetical protein
MGDHKCTNLSRSRNSLQHHDRGSFSLLARQAFAGMCTAPNFTQKFAKFFTHYSTGEFNAKVG